VPGPFPRSLAALLFALSLTGCNRPDQHPAAPGDRLPAPPVDSVVTPDEHPPTRARHDLSADEAMGGHTLARHVGKTDAELLERLRREPQISSASTYSDRDTAERTIAAALESPGRQFEAWRRRTGRRPNFVLRYTADRTIGRTVTRGRSSSAPCRLALIVIRWDDRRDRYYILTSYPEEPR
jgi:Bacterial CdiA-CT RNAse A domain